MVCNKNRNYFTYADKAINLATWNMRIPPNFYGDRNMLFMENSLLHQASGAFVDVKGCFSDCALRHDRLKRPVEDGDEAILNRHLRAWSGGNLGELTYDPGGPVLVCLQIGDDSALRFYSSDVFMQTGPGKRAELLLKTLARVLPAGVDVLIRPHPRQAKWTKKPEVPKHWQWDLAEERISEVVSGCSAIRPSSTVRSS